MSQNRILQNAKWIIVCKIVQSLIQMIIGMITARYLGPSNYGLISYAGSVVAFAVPIMQLGMRSTLVQEYVTQPEKEGIVLGTSLALNLLCSVACIIGVICFSLVANSGEKSTIVVCALYSISLSFQAIEMLQYWFQAKLLSKYSSLAMLAAYIIVSIYRVFLLIAGKSVYWFALVHSVEYGASGILLLIIYKRLKGQSLSFSKKLAKEMLAKSKYYILANLMVTVFQNTDHIMLKAMVGDAENGFYTTAITCSGIANFVYNALLDSARPMILTSRQQSVVNFEKDVSGLYSAFIYLTLVQSVIFTVFARCFVLVLFGDAYLAAVPVLQIIIWQLLFSYIGSVRNIWILAENKHNCLWVINLLGVLANIVLNAFMIPVWGACGAAFASVVTQVFTNFIVGFFIGEIRPNNVLLLKGLNPMCLFGFAKQVMNR